MIKRNNRLLVLLALLVLLMFKSCSPLSNDNKEKETLTIPSPSPSPEHEDSILKNKNLVITPINNGLNTTTEDTDAQFWFNITFGELNLQNDVLDLKEKNLEIYNKLVNFIYSLEIEYYLQNESDRNKATITLFPSRSESVNQIVTQFYTPSISVKSRGNFTAGDTLPIVMSIKGIWEDKPIVSNYLIIEPILSSIYDIYTGVDKDKVIMKAGSKVSILLSVRNKSNNSVNTYYTSKITDFSADRNFVNIFPPSQLDDINHKRFLLASHQKGETSIIFSVITDNNITLKKTLNVISN